MTDNGDYYVCQYDRRGHPVPAFGPYALGAAYTLMEQLEQSGGDEVILPPSYTVLALPGYEKRPNGRPKQAAVGARIT